MPSYRHHDFGNMYVQFEVKFPEKLSGPPDSDGYPTALGPEGVKMLEAVLPPRQPQNIPPPDAMTEDYSLEKVDASEGRAARATDEDEDEMGAGGERVQCASQ